mmetsp:Transcript_897/g.2019  ORF Transcript_897/g.2019 Transcript_897/m.2019 type:complete len:209 (-) Transcript_897:289-915(-)
MPAFLHPWQSESTMDPCNPYESKQVQFHPSHNHVAMEFPTDSPKEDTCHRNFHFHHRFPIAVMENLLLSEHPTAVEYSLDQSSQAIFETPPWYPVHYSPCHLHWQRTHPAHRPREAMSPSQIPSPPPSFLLQRPSPLLARRHLVPPRTVRPSRPPRASRASLPILPITEAIPRPDRRWQRITDFPVLSNWHLNLVRIPVRIWHARRNI